jgi:hypothetical protein
MSEELTLEEKKKILLTAESLIREPDNWIRGVWKCPAVRVPRDKRGRPGRPEHATDANGNQLFNYCIEGAVNEATYRVLGKERLAELGASTIFGKEDARKPTAMLGLNAISRELYGVGAMNYNDRKSSTHEGVLAILRTGLKEVTAKLKGKKSV